MEQEIDRLTTSDGGEVALSGKASGDPESVAEAVRMDGLESTTAVRAWVGVG